MKANLLVVAVCAQLLVASFAFGCGGYGGCGGGGCGGGGCGGGCGGGGCGNTFLYNDSCLSACCDFDTPCQCTDPGANWNDCLNRCDYCEAFGNVGGR